jgi:hypothetical protein
LGNATEPRGHPLTAPTGGRTLETRVHTLETDDDTADRPDSSLAATAAPETIYLTLGAAWYALAPATWGALVRTGVAAGRLDPGAVDRLPEARRLEPALTQLADHAAPAAPPMRAASPAAWVRAPERWTAADWRAEAARCRDAGIETGPTVLTRLELARRCRTRAPDLPRVINDAGHRREWVGLGWMARGTPSGDETVIID